MLAWPLVRSLGALALLAAGQAAWAGDGFDPIKLPVDGIGAVPVSSHLSVGSPIQVGGVSVFPVIDDRGDKADDTTAVLTLPEALREGTLRVSETTDGATVARLLVHNTGKTPVLIMAGEVVTGGRQDRVITKDVVIPPTARPIAVDVNCVEQGRWTATASLGDRFGYGGRAELGLRRVVQVERSQDATWRAVARLNDDKARVVGAAGELSPDTGTYMASIRSTAVDRRVEKVGAELLEKLDKVHGVVGMVVAFDGRVVASEVYAHHDLFDRVAADSVQAVARDAVSRGVVDISPARPSAVAAARFLADAVDRAPAIAATSVPAPVTGDATVSWVLVDDEGNLVHLASYSR